MSLEQSVTALEQRNAELVSEVVRARDAVMGLSNMYTTITLGLAGTEDGQYFTVPGNGAYQKLYQHDGAQAPLIATYPNKSDLTDALTTLNTAISDHVALPDPHTQYADQANTYTETEVDSLLDDKAAIAGQTFTGDIAAPKITTSTGILFGTDTAAANTLDDYEEGTWTPEITFDGNNVGVTYTAQSGTYTKEGNIVSAELWINISSKGTSTGDARIAGFPFSAFNFGSAAIGFMTNVTAGLGDQQNLHVIDTNQTMLELRYMGASGSAVRINDSDITDDLIFIMSVTYQSN